MTELTSKHIDRFKDIQEELKTRLGEGLGEIRLEIALGIYKQVCKDRRMKAYREREDLATKKQKKYLDVLEVDYDEDITKEEASELIEKNK